MPRDAKGDLKRDAWLRGAPIWITPVEPIRNWADQAPALAGFPSFTEEQGERVLEKRTGPQAETLRPAMRIDHIAVTRQVKTPAESDRFIEESPFSSDCTTRGASVRVAMELVFWAQAAPQDRRIRRKPGVNDRNYRGSGCQETVKKLSALESVRCKATTSSCGICCRPQRGIRSDCRQERGNRLRSPRRGALCPEPGSPSK